MWLRPTTRNSIKTPAFAYQSSASSYCFKFPFGSPPCGTHRTVVPHPTMTDPLTPSTPTQARNSRRKRMAALVLIALLGAAAWGAYDILVASHQEDTDNAYVQGNIIQITPQVGGTVMSILADDNDLVHAGAPLVRLDPADTNVAFKQAEAALAQTVRQVRQLYANNATLAAQVKLQETNIAKARAAQAQARTALKSAEQDMQRRLQLGSAGAVSQEELKHAENALSLIHI